MKILQIYLLNLFINLILILFVIFRNNLEIEVFFLKRKKGAAFRFLHPGGLSRRSKG